MRHGPFLGDVSTGRTAAIARLRTALEGAAWEKASNGEMTRAVGMDLCEAAFAFGEGRFDAAIGRLEAVRDTAWRFGGSHAQRDVLTLTLIEAARRNGQHRLAAHYAHERIVHKPASGWGWRLLERAKPRKKESAHA